LKKPVKDSKTKKKVRDGNFLAKRGTQKNNPAAVGTERTTEEVKENSTFDRGHRKPMGTGSRRRKKSDITERAATLLGNHPILGQNFRKDLQNSGEIVSGGKLEGMWSIQFEGCWYGDKGKPSLIPIGNGDRLRHRLKLERSLTL